MGDYIGEYYGVLKRDARSLTPPPPSARAPQAMPINRVRVPRAYGDQSIHAQTIIPFVFQEQMLIRASMPKP